MPHMSPMWWTFTYLSITMSMLTMMTIMYFYFTPKSKKSEMKNKLNTINWKW
uniref:ATPase subunit 8 n=1 Tax=Mezira sp. TaxID=2931906 RepID=A0A8T9VZ03_9HEMI|nr:ATPase subunit 8 [Mezira sp.]